jgi:hypothetical protein
MIVAGCGGSWGGGNRPIELGLTGRTNEELIARRRMRTG